MLRVAMVACLSVSTGAWLLADDDSNVPTGGKSNPESQTLQESEQPGEELPEHQDVHAHEHSAPGDAPSAGPFEAAILGITLRSDPSYTVYLKSVEVRRLGQQMFLVGLGADSGTLGWTVGRRSWVAIDDIAEILEFESEEELQEILSEDPGAIGPDA